MAPDADPIRQRYDTEGLSQQLRLAVVMTGGVSLAIWMGGVARELNLLLHQGEPDSGPSQRIRRCYQDLLDLVSIDVSLDVLSGTSAGGINAAILGLANVNNADIGQLRELWLEQGAFGRLLRDPNVPPTPSLLKGDEQLLNGLRTGLQALVQENPDASLFPAAADQESPRQTDVFITTTLLDGEPSRFVDDYNTLVSDVDHHGLFHFDTDRLAGLAAADRLALAARCSASFPVAFEAAHLTIGPDTDAQHPDMSSVSDVTRPCYVADGGLLANRPIAAAVRAVFDRPASQEVRRVLLYVVPTATAATVPEGDVAPLLGAAVLKDLGAMTSQAITADLASIRAHNESVRVRLDSYGQLAMIGERVVGGLVSDALYGQYGDRVSDSIAGALADEALRQLDPAMIALDSGAASGEAQTPAPGVPPPLGDQARQLRADVAARIASQLPRATPRPGDFSALGQLGRRGYDAAKVIILDLIRGAYLAHPNLDERRNLAKARQAVHDALPPPSVKAMDIVDIVSTARAGGSAGVPLATRLADQWSSRQQTASQLAAGWQRLAAAAAAAMPLLNSLIRTGTSGQEPDPGSIRTRTPGPEQGHGAVLGYLASRGGDADAIAGRLAELHIAQTALLPDTQVADQQLELIQVSADTATRLDSRNNAADKLTGLQLHHFGAFYKYSWRANDWMWGRLDGAGWLVHVLLDPRRLRSLRKLDNDPAGYRQRLIDGLRRVAGATKPGSGDAAVRGDREPEADPDLTIPAGVQRELDLLWQPDEPLLASMPETAKWVASGIQRMILEEELPSIARQIEADSRAGAVVNDAAKAFLTAMRDPLADVTSQLAACRVSDEKFIQEMPSRLFQKTFKQTALVAVTALVSSGKVPGPVKFALRALRLELRLVPAWLLTRSASLLRGLWPRRG